MSEFKKVLMPLKGHSPQRFFTLSRNRSSSYGMEIDLFQVIGVQLSGTS